MKTNAKLGMILAIILFLSSAAFACNIGISGFTTQVSAGSDFTSAVSAGTNTDIDVRVNFNVDTFTGSDCPQNIAAQARIYRLNNTTGIWEQVNTSDTKTQGLTTGPYSFVWNSVLNTGDNSNYMQFKVTGVALNNSTDAAINDAYVTVVDNSCSGIGINATDITLNEASTTTKSFSINNNTDSGFSISSANIYFTSNVVNSNAPDYSSYVAPHSLGTLTISFNSGYVSSTTNLTGTIALNGYLGGTNCAYSDIGLKSFNIAVLNTGATASQYDNYYNGYYNNNYYNNTYYPGGNTDCTSLQFQASDFSMDEGTTQSATFGLKNNSQMRFEIQQIQTSNNGIQLSQLTNDQYIFPGQIGSVVLNATAPNIVGTTAYTNTVNVMGRFSNGEVCTLGDINGNFTTTVTDTSATILNCSGFTLTAPATATIQNFGSIPITINNSSGKPATIYIEGTADAVPTIIALPTSTSINRSLSVSMAANTGYITLRPVVEGCTLAATTINLANTGSTAPVTQQSAQNQNGGLAGLFALGGITGPLGLIIVIIVIVILLAGLIVEYDRAHSKKDEDQPWVK